jgi:hypothetical protein
MKKLLTIFFLLLGCTTAFALPVANPAEASLMTCGFFSQQGGFDSYDTCFKWVNAWRFRIGYSGDFVFNRHMKINGSGFGHGKNIEKFQLNTNAGYLAVNFADLVDLYSTYGATKMHLVTNETSWQAIANSVSSFNWHSTFSWSVGGRATLFQCKNFFLGIEGQYFQTKPKLDYFVSIFLSPQFQYFNHTCSKYSEWQVGGGVSYAFTSCICNFSLLPYMAVKWARSCLNTGNLTFTQLSNSTLVTLFNLKAAKQWGYAVGVTACYCNMFCITTEGRWGDETAFNVNGNFTF